MTVTARTIVSQYCDGVPAQMEHLSSLVDRAWPRGGPDHAVVAEALNETHRMGGAAHCMGFALFGKALLEIGEQLGMSLDTGEADPAEAVWRAQHLCGLAQRQSRFVTTANSTLLKAMAESGAATASTLKDRDSLAGQRILFVEDDPSIRDLVQHMLQEGGVMGVELAESGREALAKAENFKPTMILTDWSMKAMDGLELLRHIRAGETALPQDLPIIMMTARNNLKNVRSIVRGGADHFLLKPFTREVLIGAIARIAQRARTNAGGGAVAAE